MHVYQKRKLSPWQCTCLYIVRSSAGAKKTYKRRKTLYIKRSNAGAEEIHQRHEASCWQCTWSLMVTPAPRKFTEGVKHHPANIPASQRKFKCRTKEIYQNLAFVLVYPLKYRVPKARSAILTVYLFKSSNASSKRWYVILTVYLLTHFKVYCRHQENPSKEWCSSLTGILAFTFLIVKFRREWILLKAWFIPTNQGCDVILTEYLLTH